MEDLLLRLEKQIKQLIDQHDQLKASNQQLHEGKYILACEKDALLTRQQKAILQIETLVSKLKAIEKIT
jgi:uncharacterized protein (TIGR02449 family)